MEEAIDAIRVKAQTLEGKSGGDECAPVEQRLAESLDIGVTAEDLELLKAEMQGCPPCLEFIESLKTTVKLCHDFGVKQEPTPLTEDTRLRMVAAYESVIARRSKNSQ